MQRSLKTCFATALLNQAAEALKVFTKEDDTCELPSGWTATTDPIVSNGQKDGTTYENMIITCPPDTKVCVKVGKDNITLRNMIIYHPANGMGIYGWTTENLLLENVQVIAYGNEWGAQPCPSDSLNGFKCDNIGLNYAPNVVMRNVEVDSGSKGISIKYSPNALLTNVVSKNVRGPFSGGACFHIGSSSHGTVLENFHCYNDPQISWTEDAVSIYHSSGVIVRHGVIDGSNSKTGQGLMFEGSSPDAIGGIVDDVEVINTTGCFGYFPHTGIFQHNSVCASPKCASHNQPRGSRHNVNLWTAGKNTASFDEDYYASNIWVEDSYIYDVCDEDEMKVSWEYEDGVYTNFGVTELEEFTPRTPPTANLPWDVEWQECWRPTTTCADFLQEWIGGDQEDRTSTNDADKSTYEELQGSCYGNKAWNDGLGSPDPDKRVL